jgi:ribose transport system substrate-binding protein
MAGRSRPKLGRVAFFRPGPMLAVIAAVVVSACGTSSSTPTTAPTSSTPTTAPTSSTPTTAPTSSRQYTIVMIPGSTTNAFYVTAHAGAVAEAEKLGVNLVWQGAENFDASAQIPVAQSLLATHPDGLAIVPTSPTGLTPVIQQYITAGIPVVTFDTSITTPDILLANITSDNVQGGTAAADTLGTLTGGKGSVAYMAGNSGNSVDDARFKGFSTEMQSKYPQMPMVARDYNNNDPSVAETQTESVLLAHPDLVGIFAENDQTGVGVAKAIEAKGLQGKVFIVTYDAAPTDVAALKSGALNALIMQDPAREAATALDDIYWDLNGQQSKIEKSLVIPNVVATQANMNDPGITKYFYGGS